MNEPTLTEVLEWITPAQAALIAGRSAARMTQLADEGKIRHIQTPLGRLFDPQDVRRWAESHA